MLNLSYFLESSLILGLGYGYYHFLLRKEAHFHFHRIYLLGVVASGFLLPLIQLQYSVPGGEWLQSANGMLEETVIQAVMQEQSSGMQLLGWIYWLGAGFLASRFLWKLGHIIRLIHQHPGSSRDGVRIVHTSATVPISSFFHVVFWHEVDYLKAHQQEQIMTHELCHVRQKHSIDTLLMELLLIVFWFQPFLYLLRKAIHQNHEFIADRASVQISDVRSYTQLILTQLFGQQLSYVHSFFHPPLTLRVSMLQKQRSSPLASWKYLALLPLFVALLITVSCAPDTQNIQAENIAEVQLKDTQVNQEVQHLPNPLNMGDIQMKIGYPKAAFTQGLEGKVLIKVLVDKQGKYLRHEVLQSPDDIFTDAVEQHIASLTFDPALKDGKPVEFWVTLPFNFKFVN
ncbi:MAG: M56 family metallopeptidase [Bacteroidota bacterium]